MSPPQGWRARRRDSGDAESLLIPILCLLLGVTQIALRARRGMSEVTGPLKRKCPIPQVRLTASLLAVINSSILGKQGGGGLLPKAPTGTSLSLRLGASCPECSSAF